MKDVLLDTNILIGHLNGDEASTALLAGLDCIRISVITEYEMLAGLTDVRDQQRRMVLELLEHAVVYPVTSAVARRAADYTVRYGGRKTADRLIAATVKEQRLKGLVSFNDSDFPMIKIFK